MAWKHNNQDSNIQYYVNTVKQKKIHWDVFVKSMEDLSHSDMNKLKVLNEILLNELTISNTEMDRLKYLNVILMTKFKDSIQLGDNNVEIIENGDPLEHYQTSTADYDLNEETIEEISSDNEIQISIVCKNEMKKIFDLPINEALLEDNFEFRENEDLEEYYQTPTIHYDSNEETNQEMSSDNEIQASIIGTNERIENFDKPESNQSQPNQTKFHCSLCDKKYDHLHLKKNNRNVHEMKRKYKCDSCDKQFSQVEDLKEHMCDKLFPQAEYLKLDTQTKYKCESCNRSFTKIGRLNRHIHTVHEGHKDHKCEL